MVGNLTKVDSSSKEEIIWYKVMEYDQYSHLFWWCCCARGLNALLKGERLEANGYWDKGKKMQSISMAESMLSIDKWLQSNEFEMLLEYTEEDRISNWYGDEKVECVTKMTIFWKLKGVMIP